MKKTLVMLFIQLLISGFLSQLHGGTTSSQILDELSQSLHQLRTRNYVLDEAAGAKIVARLEELSGRKIDLPDSSEFESIRQKIDKISILFDIMLIEVDFTQGNHHPLFVTGTAYCQLLTKLQDRVKESFKKLAWLDQFKNMLPYTQGQTAFTFARANILTLVAIILSHGTPDDSKKDYWLTIDAMFEQIDFEKFETNKNIDKKYLLVLLERLIGLVDTLKSTFQNENDPECKNIAAGIVKKFSHIQPFFQIQLESTREWIKNNEIPDAVDWFNRGNNGADPQVKIEHYTRAILFNPKLIPAYFNRGVVYQQLAEYEKAIQDYHQVLEFEADNALCYYHRGNCYQNLDQHYEAIQDYSKALEFDSNYAVAYNNRGNSLRKLGKDREAIQDYSKAIELNDENALVYNNRGTSYLNSGAPGPAIKDYLRAIELTPDNATFHFNLACAYWAVEDWPAVISTLERCLELAPGYENANEYLTMAKKAQKDKQFKSNLRKLLKPE